jgi:hypothetical protein
VVVPVKLVLTLSVERAGLVAQENIAIILALILPMAAVVVAAVAPRAPRAATVAALLVPLRLEPAATGSRTSAGVAGVAVAVLAPVVQASC